ncbi:hypothetical protein ACQU0X_28905 [Pseudovibrio ascidiaceicola]|uniref:hypothetical protein n=1 Tax=Pseudovibrio ascidiaceicola TaxID=285279 RepID=UPI003D3673E3
MNTFLPISELPSTGDEVLVAVRHPKKTETHIGRYSEGQESLIAVSCEGEIFNEEDGDFLGWLPKPVFWRVQDGTEPMPQLDFISSEGDNLAFDLIVKGHPEQGIAYGLTEEHARTIVTLCNSAPLVIEALDNLENDDGKCMPETAWELVQAALDAVGIVPLPPTRMRVECAPDDPRNQIMTWVQGYVVPTSGSKRMTDDELIKENERVRRLVRPSGRATPICSAYKPADAEWIAARLNLAAEASREIERAVEAERARCAAIADKMAGPHITVEEGKALQEIRFPGAGALSNG